MSFKRKSIDNYISSKSGNRRCDGVKLCAARVRFSNNQIRLLSFWDKRDNENTLVITTNGFVKKTQKTPKTEINKAKIIRSEYLKY